MRGAHPDAAPMHWDWLAEGARTWWGAGWTGDVAREMVGGGGARSLLMLSLDVDSQIWALRWCLRWQRLRTSSETDTSATDRWRCVSRTMIIIIWEFISRNYKTLSQLQNIDQTNDTHSSTTQLINTTDK